MADASQAALGLHTRRLGTGDRALAQRLFELLAEVFEEGRTALGDSYVEGLLARADFWVIAAFDGAELVGGLTAHVLPMTRSESAELFIYDIAVRADHQRRGVGRRLVADLRSRGADAGVHVTFVAADDEDTHALDFYRALGGNPSPVTIFDFGGES